MTREEIGSHLGMKLETVSRMFSKFGRDGTVETHGKQIRILDLGALIGNVPLAVEGWDGGCGIG
jgi:CRP/FNR family transcriptional regulator